jgi:hypothetical protein
MELANLPQWIGTAVLGAILALLGWVGKQLAEWRATLRAEERNRRARLAELLALIRAGDAAFKVQSENRDRLAKLIRSRNATFAEAGHGYDKLFALAFPTMSGPERELYDVVRSVTIHTFQPLNEALLKWLAADVEFRVRPPDKTRRAQPAKYLTDLEAHLLLWQAKFKAWIPDHPEHALVYLADEERHGVGFPKGGAQLVADILHQHRRVGA